MRALMETPSERLGRLMGEDEATIQRRREKDLEMFGVAREGVEAPPRAEGEIATPAPETNAPAPAVEAYAAGGGPDKSKSADDDDEPASPFAEDPSGDSSPPTPATA
jgi:hypothetical protein